MLVIQKGFTRLVKRYVEEQHPIIFQNISDWLLRMFRQHQKDKKQQERDYQTPKKKQAAQIDAQSEAETATRRIEPRTKNANSAKKNSQQHKQRRAALSLEKKRQVNQENNKSMRKGQQHTRKCAINTGLEPLRTSP